MKKLTTLILTFFLLIGVMYSQEGEPQHGPDIETTHQAKESDKIKQPGSPSFWIGGKLGLGLSFAYDVNATEQSGSTTINDLQFGAGVSWELGADGLYYFSKFIALRFELSIVSHGFTSWICDFVNVNNLEITSTMLNIQTSLMFDLGGYTPYIGFYIGIDVYNSMKGSPAGGILKTAANFGMAFSFLSFSATFGNTKMLFTWHQRISFTNPTSYSVSNSKGEHTHWSSFFSISVLFGL